MVPSKCVVWGALSQRQEGELFRGERPTPVSPRINRADPAHVGSYMQTAAEIIAHYKSIQAKPWHHRSSPPAPRMVPVEDHTPQVQPIPITYTMPRVIYFPQAELRRAESVTRI